MLLEVKQVESYVVEAGISVSGIVWIVSKVSEDIISTFYELREKRVRAQHLAEKTAEHFGGRK